MRFADGRRRQRSVNDLPVITPLKHPPATSRKAGAIVAHRRLLIDAIEKTLAGEKSLIMVDEAQAPHHLSALG
jgi:hypothetical protein